MDRLRNRVALVTGAASGIGAATVRLFLQEGACVIGGDIAPITWRRPEVRFEPMSIDVRCPDHWRRVVDATVARYGALDILVNCAGLNPVRDLGHDAEQVSITHWRHTQEVNVEGTLLGCQHALPELRRSRYAAIVNLSCLAAIIGVPDDPAYGASKAAVQSYTKSLALYCAGTAIRCNSLHPGGIRTPTFWPLTSSHSNGVQVPMRRLGEAEEVAWAVLFLAGDDASYITGTELFVDGGLSAT